MNPPKSVWAIAFALGAAPSCAAQSEAPPAVVTLRNEIANANASFETAIRNAQGARALDRIRANQHIAELAATERRRFQEIAAGLEGVPKRLATSYAMSLKLLTTPEGHDPEAWTLFTKELQAVEFESRATGETKELRILPPNGDGQHGDVAQTLSALASVAMLLRESNRKSQVRFVVVDVHGNPVKGARIQYRRYDDPESSPALTINAVTPDATEEVHWGYWDFWAVVDGEKFSTTETKAVLSSTKQILLVQASKPETNKPADKVEGK